MMVNAQADARVIANHGTRLSGRISNWTKPVFSAPATINHLTQRSNRENPIHNRSSVLVFRSPSPNHHPMRKELGWQRHLHHYP
jgi:hypothetical protein